MAELLQRAHYMPDCRALSTACGLKVTTIYTAE